MSGLPRPEEVIIFASVFGEEINSHFLANLLNMDKKAVEEILQFYVKMDTLEIRQECFFFKEGKREIFFQKKNQLSHAPSLVSMMDYLLEENKKTKSYYQQQLQKSTEVLIYLTKHESFREGNVEVALQLITENLANVIDVQRVSIWAYHVEKALIECLDLYEKNKKEHSNGVLLYEKDFPNYFKALKQETVINAPDARNHPHTAQFTEAYFKPLDIYSLLDVPFYINGKIGGVICFEHQYHIKQWTFEEIMFATSMCSMVSLAYQSLQIKLDQVRIEEINDELKTQNEELQQQQEEILAQRDSIEAKNRELLEQEAKINASIQAARLIQQAILPKEKQLDYLLRDYFVLNLPRDVVSGDFFWIDYENNSIVLAIMDCTGHGVPGAFMSMIGKTLLDKIVKVWNITNPAEILSRLNKEVQNALQQQEEDNNVGMDGAIVCIEKGVSTSKLTFAGAKRPLYYIPQKGENVVEVKGTSRHLGGISNKPKVFENVELEMNKGALIYLCSDGFTDQNDVHRKSFGKIRLIELLKRVSVLSLAEQKVTLEDTLKTYMKGTQQRDDILVVGFSL